MTRYAKAIAAAISAAATVIAAAVPEDSTAGIIAAVIIAVCGTVAVWAVPNADPEHDALVKAGHAVIALESTSDQPAAISQLAAALGPKR